MKSAASCAKGLLRQVIGDSSAEDLAAQDLDPRTVGEPCIIVGQQGARGKPWAEEDELQVASLPMIGDSSARR